MEWKYQKGQKRRYGFVFPRGKLGSFSFSFFPSSFLRGRRESKVNNSMVMLLFFVLVFWFAA